VRKNLNLFIAVSFVIVLSTKSANAQTATFGGYSSSLAALGAHRIAQQPSVYSQGFSAYHSSAFGSNVFGQGQTCANGTCSIANSTSAIPSSRVQSVAAYPQYPSSSYPVISSFPQQQFHGSYPAPSRAVYSPHVVQYSSPIYYSTMPPSCYSGSTISYGHSCH
jgi:hypothetical protein